MNFENWWQTLFQKNFTFWWIKTENPYLKESMFVLEEPKNGTVGLVEKIQNNFKAYLHINLCNAANTAVVDASGRKWWIASAEWSTNGWVIDWLWNAILIPTKALFPEAANENNPIPPSLPLQGSAGIERKLVHPEFSQIHCWKSCSLKGERASDWRC